MAPRTHVLLLTGLALAACGAIRDPDPDERDEWTKVRAGSVASRTVVLEDSYEGDDFSHWDWDEHVRDLPAGFRFETLDVDDGDGWLDVTYEIRVDAWVEPGDYRFHVRYEFWPIDDILREEYDVDFYVRVKRPRSGSTRLVLRQSTPRTGEPVLLVTALDLDDPVSGR